MVVVVVVVVEILSAEQVLSTRRNKQENNVVIRNKQMIMDDLDILQWKMDNFHRLPPKGERRCKDFACFLPTSFFKYLNRVMKVFGRKFVFYLFFTQFFVKGLLFRMLVSSMLPIFKESGQLDATTLQLYSTIAMSPWVSNDLYFFLQKLIWFTGNKASAWGFIGHDSNRRLS